ncbi:hypothetical protein CEXT_63791, partial [Caerostris extrusa]
MAPAKSIVRQLIHQIVPASTKPEPHNDQVSRFSIVMGASSGRVIADPEGDRMSRVLEAQTQSIL